MLHIISIYLSVCLSIFFFSFLKNVKATELFSTLSLTKIPFQNLEMANPRKIKWRLLNRGVNELSRTS